MTWPGLLAAERDAALEHLLHHVLVANRAANELDAALAQGDLQADVAHHGGDDARCCEARPVVFMCRPHINSTASPSTIAPISVDEDGAVAVAVEGDADAALPFDHRARQTLGMGRSAIEVDVPAIRCGAQQLDIEAQLAEQARRDRGRRAVGGVDGDAHPAQPLGVGQRQARVRDVRVDDVGALDWDVGGAADASSEGSAMIASTSRSSVSVNFSPRPENTLMPLS